MKTCGICRDQKPLESFSKDSSKADGLCFKCKACMSKYHKQRLKHARQRCKACGKPVYNYDSELTPNHPEG